MIASIKSWFRDRFSHPDAVLIVIFLLVASTTIFFFGEMLAPVLGAIVIAYMLEALVQYFVKRSIPRIIGVFLSFFIFLAALLFIVIGIIPVVSKQVSNFLHDLPKIVSQGRDLLMNLQLEYPSLLNAEQVNNLVASAVSEFTSLGQSV
ncbi:MAG: AI-2E family transporter, partial [Pseudomonadota bacterium]|nr:AI-2E family transporter [Pseudomonadota bacterium]